MEEISATNPMKVLVIASFMVPIRAPMFEHPSLWRPFTHLLNTVSSLCQELLT